MSELAEPLELSSEQEALWTIGFLFAELDAYSALVGAMTPHDPLAAKVLARLPTLPPERAVRLLAAWVVMATCAGSVEVHDAAREAVRRMVE